jgi:hypothetical protein
MSLASVSKIEYRRVMRAKINIILVKLFNDMTKHNLKAIAKLIVNEKFVLAHVF